MFREERSLEECKQSFLIERTKLEKSLSLFEDKHAFDTLSVKEL